MDEREFKRTYADFNDRPCVFTKAVLRGCAGCSRSQRVYIAEREAMACRSPDGHKRCQELVDSLRHNALFALRLTHLEGPLPHGKEVKVECGGLLGLQSAVDAHATDKVPDVYKLIALGLERWGGIEAFPFSRIAQSVVHFQARRGKV